MTIRPATQASREAPRPAAVRRGRRRGFTLLELLVAPTLAVMLAAAMFAALRFVLRAKDGATAAVEPSRTADVAMEIIRADLESALPPTDQQAGQLAGPFVGTGGADGGGDPTDLTFFCTAEAPAHPFGTGEIKKVEYLLSTPAGATEPVLLRRVSGNLLPPQGVETTPDEEVVCRGVTLFAASYYDGTQWQTTWDSLNVQEQQNLLPLAVQVTIELNRPSPDGQPARGPVHTGVPARVRHGPDDGNRRLRRLRHDRAERPPARRRRRPAGKSDRTKSEASRSRRPAKGRRDRRNERTR